jgi:diphthamide synthase (EF-2-diphthine--ammonia ligase)
MKPRTAISWSGGKDSHLALHRNRSRSHGLRLEIFPAQADGCWAIDMERLDAVGV